MSHRMVTIARIAFVCSLVAVLSYPGTCRGEESGAPSETSEPRNRVDVRGEWLYVDGEPFLVKGVGYSPARPGQLPWES